MIYSNDASFLAYFNLSTSDDQAALQPLVELILDVMYSPEEGDDTISCVSADSWEETSQVKETVIELGGALTKPADDDCVKDINRIEDRLYFLNDMLTGVNGQLQDLQDWVNNISSGVDFPVINNPHNEDEWVNNNPFWPGDLNEIPKQVDNLHPNNLQLECWVNNLDIMDTDENCVPGSLVLVNTQVADDDRLNKELNRIEDREYFFNDLFSCISAELQELQAWVNNLDSEVSSLVNKDSHIEDEWVNNNPFQIDSWIPTVNEVDSLESNNPQIEDWDNIFDGSAIPDQIMAQLVDWSNCDEDDALDNLNLWFTSQAKSEEEGSTLPVIDESQLNDWVNKHSEVDSLANTSLHYQVQYGGKLQSEAALVEGRWSFSWILTSGGTSYKSPYNFHTCMSKQAKKALSLQT